MNAVASANQSYAMRQKVEFIALPWSDVEERIERSVRLATEDALKTMVERLEEAASRLYLLKEWLTTREAAHYLGISVSTLKDDWRHRYAIPCRKVRAQLYWRRTDLEAFLSAAG